MDCFSILSVKTLEKWMAVSLFHCEKIGLSPWFSPIQHCFQCSPPKKRRHLHSPEKKYIFKIVWNTFFSKRMERTPIFEKEWRAWRFSQKNGENEGKNKENGDFSQKMGRTDIFPKEWRKRRKEWREWRFLKKNGENGEKNGENGDFPKRMERTEILPKERREWRKEWREWRFSQKNGENGDFAKRMERMEKRMERMEIFPKERREWRLQNPSPFFFFEKRFSVVLELKNAYFLQKKVKNASQKKKEWRKSPFSPFFSPFSPFFFFEKRFCQKKIKLLLRKKTSPFSPCFSPFSPFFWKNPHSLHSFLHSLHSFSKISILSILFSILSIFLEKSPFSPFFSPFSPFFYFEKRFCPQKIKLLPRENNLHFLHSFLHSLHSFSKISILSILFSILSILLEKSPFSPFFSPFSPFFYFEKRFCPQKIKLLPRKNTLHSLHVFLDSLHFLGKISIFSILFPILSILLFWETFLPKEIKWFPKEMLPISTCFSPFSPFFCKIPRPLHSSREISVSRKKQVYHLENHVEKIQFPSSKRFSKKHEEKNGDFSQFFQEWRKIVMFPFVRPHSANYQKKGRNLHAPKKEEFTLYKHVDLFSIWTFKTVLRKI